MGCRPMPKNHRLQQRVRGQPIRPMHACTGHLTGSVKTPNGRGTVKIGDNSTALVVLSRRYGNEIAGDVNAHLQTARIDGWEVALKLLLRNMPGIEIDTVYFTPLHLTDNSPRDHIARRQLFQRVIALHKRLSILMAKLSSLPRNASVMRKARALGWYSVVGWNWMNSILAIGAPMRHAIATPSPVATSGLVVCS